MSKKITVEDIRDAVNRAFAEDDTAFMNEATEIVVGYLGRGDNLVPAVACANADVGYLEQFAANVADGDNALCKTLAFHALMQVNWSRAASALRAIPAVETLDKLRSNTRYGDIDVADAYKTTMKNTPFNNGRN